MAPQSKLTAPRFASIVQHRTLCKPKHVAAALAGVSARTVQEWMNRGAAAEEAAYEALNEYHPIGRLSISLLDDDPVAAPSRTDGWDIDIAAVEYVNDNWRWTDLGIFRGDADPPFTRALMVVTPPAERPYLRFFRHMQLAEGHAEGLLLNRAREATIGVATKVTKTVETLDADGKLVGRVVTTTESSERDNQMIRWLLAVSWPERYGRRFRAEVLPGNDEERDDGLGTLEDEKAGALRELDEMEDEVAAQREKMPRAS